MAVMKITGKVKAYFQEQGRIGGIKRSANLTPEQRRKIARAAACARWSQKKEEEIRSRKRVK